MKTLLIDNGTIRLDKVKEIIGHNKITVIEFQQISQFDIKYFDLIILSGSSQFSVLKFENLFRAEIELIKNSNIPVVGICLGFELIAFAYGAKLERLENKSKDFVEIRILISDVIFNKLPNFEVFESHRWVVKDVPDELIELAESNQGIEVIKHKHKTIYGFQFHPELFVNKTCGHEIFTNLLRDIKKTIKRI